MLDWGINSWIIIAVGFLAAAGCGLLGVFLVLRRMSMVTDAISHAVLPGIAVAFLLSHSRDPIVMLVGAGAVGVLTTFLIEWVHRSGRIQTDAAIGIVFTALFALGVVIISAKAGMVDLDQDCVLYGEIAYSPWDDLVMGGRSWGPRPLWILGSMAVVNLLFIVVFYKELKLSTFDPALATTLGFSAVLMHYLLMGLVSLTTVAAFESIGAVLVVALFVVPAATAYLLTDRLAMMLLLVIPNAAVTSLGGYALARWLDASIAGAMTTVSGALFLSALLFARRKGIFARLAALWSLRLRIAAEDALALLYKQQESKQPARSDPVASPLSMAKWLPLYLRLKGLVSASDGGFVLTQRGLARAVAIIRRHRSWEGYLHDEFAVPPDHVHRPAHEIEHFLDESAPEHKEVLSSERSDPHGSDIPK